MKKILLMLTVVLLSSCNTNSSKNKSEPLKENAKVLDEDHLTSSDTLTKHLKPFREDLPTLGLLMYDGVLQSEVIAASDVFAKPTEDGQQLFNVVSIAETENPITTEEGMHFVPDYTFKNCPKLTALFVPSAYDMYAQVHNDKIVNFIKGKNKETEYIVSNCAGAQLIGESGIADGYKIVTWIGGGEQLQKDYPKLKVQDDSTVTFVEDGKFLSSNGNLASYISALNLLEKMTSTEHRKFVENYLYLGRLQNWEK
ncbi:DJ-1/PfpI family protein [Zobellia galactanivorans]|uniref:DJ-1/PfpI family protein n=1 Tax=Zobellia galactanivorans (strain DSM 12802 / CCUG 47099 / CIP 106680 / NCIMB 13871 / Dsij) TaxID=63186 RepID=UPI0026E2DA4F|nr:DJ-1/PfpI family protein [Zobellia galactanivorans]MDO6811147.1 DJ-1/PfpI family protein [Zobellia galactanivorans]